MRHCFSALFVALLLVPLLGPGVSFADEPEESTEDELSEPIEDIGRDHRASSGAGLTIGAGASTGVRSMDFSGQNGSIEHAPGPFLGGLVDLALDLHYFEDAEAGLRLEASGTYATATDSEPDPELGRPLVAQSTQLGATAVVSRALRESWDLRVGAGLERVAHQLEDNDIYTGHIYWALRLQAGVEWWNTGDTLRVLTELQFLPTLSVDQSNGRYGNASAFGVRLDLEGGWFFFRPNDEDIANAAELMLRINATRYRAQFPSGGVVGARATSNDDHASVSLALRYHL